MCKIFGTKDKCILKLLDTACLPSEEVLSISAAARRIGECLHPGCFMKITSKPLPHGDCIALIGQFF